MEQGLCFNYSKQSLYKGRARLFDDEKYHILTAGLYDSVKQFEEKLKKTASFIFIKNEIPFQAVYIKMTLDPIPDELKDFKNLGKS